MLWLGYDVAMTRKLFNALLVDWRCVWLVLCLAMVSAFSVSGSEWKPVNVPGGWTEFFSDTPESEKVGWFRCWVRVPDSYFSPHERNLFEESVGIYLRDLSGFHDLRVNGVPIGQGRAHDSDIKSADGVLFRHKVPVGTLEKGMWNEISLKLTAPSRLGGFRNQAPFIMDYFLECDFEGEWEFIEDDHYVPGQATNVRPPRAAFDQFHESRRILGRTDQVHGPSLEPSESASMMRAQEGLQTELLLHEPTVTQPFHFTFDERGRLWVAQSRQYPYPAGVQMLSRDKYYRAHYDKIPPPPPNHTPGADRISIHEDTDGDGQYDSHSIFLDGLNMANSAIRGRGGVWVMHTPHLLFYPDANADDIPDGPPEVRLTGFGFEDTHSIANGLVWGPDGWLYGGQGSTCSCRVTRPDVDSPGTPGVYFEGCMVWRYHPDTKAFEIFAEGGGNTYGLEFDALGRLYSGHNGGNTRGWHFIQGGFYQMQGVNPGKFGPPRNAYAFGELPMLAADDRIVRFTHIGAFVDGTAMPENYAGNLFAIDPLHNEIIASRWIEEGSTFRTSDLGVVVKSADSAFRPVHIANAPDGSLTVSDMYEFYIAHGQHYQNQIDPTTGRIYRISGHSQPRETDLNLAGKSDHELMALLGHPNKWHRMTAVRLLGERRNPQSVSTLQSMVATQAGHASLHALWALHQTGHLDETTARLALQHPDSSVRLWTLRFLGDIYGIQRNLGLPGTTTEALPIPLTLFEALMDLARVESNAEVRSQCASTARRLAAHQGFQLAAAMMSRDEDFTDPFIPLLCWWVFEAHMPARTEAVVDFFLSSEDLDRDRPIVIGHVLPRLSRRLSVDGRRQDLIFLAELFNGTTSRNQSLALLKGYEEAFRGRSIAATTIPDELASALEKLSSTSLVLRLRQGNDQAFPEAKNRISDGEVPIAERLQLIRLLGEIHRPSDKDFLIGLASGDRDTALRKSSMAALGGYDDQKIIEVALGWIDDPSREIRLAALTLVTHRPAWIQTLLDKLDSGAVDKAIIPAEIVDILSSHTDSRIRDRMAGLFGNGARKLTSTGTLSEEDVLEIIRSGPGNPYDGESLFMERCGACHRLFFKGGNVGPDLTSYQRNDSGTLLASILNPDAEIREGFQFVTLHTLDNRTIAGFEVERDSGVTIIRGLDGQNVILENSNISDRIPVNRSLMPTGLLEDLSNKQIRDLFAYLRISQPISR